MDFNQFMSFQQKFGSETDNSRQKTRPETQHGGSVGNSTESEGRKAHLSIDTELKGDLEANQGPISDMQSLFFSPTSDGGPEGFPMGSNMTTPTITIEQSFEDHTGIQDSLPAGIPGNHIAGYSESVQRPFWASQQHQHHQHQQYQHLQHQQHLPSTYQPDYGPPFDLNQPQTLLSPNVLDDSFSTGSVSSHSIHSAGSYNHHLSGEWQPNDVALSPAPSRLTTGDDELDEILSVNSTNEPFYDAEFEPLAESIPAQSAGGFPNSVEDIFGDTYTQFDRANATERILDVKSPNFLKPQISIEEFKSFSPSDVLQNRVLSNLSSPVSFHTARQNTHFLSVQPDESEALSEDDSEVHTAMRQGRKARRQSIQVARRSSSSRRRLSVDEKARSLSEDRDRLLELAALKPSKSQNDCPEDNTDFGSFKFDESPSTDSNDTNQGKSAQKNPAIYSCHVCDKKFTRPYNLKSHLRTHTDERPFVCNICGKAFARQHDRKRHEDLHTGKKRYVCMGTLKDGTQWGCGKKFARSDALGRHFKTEGGKRCIAPLYEEVTRERAAGRKVNFDLPIDL
ncbi:LAME_0G12310g1_1 [Lachancea meyersii CBS 8951]|uniref:LAME_0G12310g1_1 n=1 Tax=Lachancea meyersii CBS 8951 TaxID=1266667 RepID=A0A1G4K9K6_9SACH|nr:LAME_0G12310g1_1 [Lachancea meyersii CBS 8951]